VWTADSLHPAQTVWLDTAGAVVATRPGVYVAAGSHLWQWVNARKRAEGIDCECYRRRDSIRGCESQERVGVAYLKDLAGKAHHLQVLGADDDLTMAPPQQSAEPLAGAGPYLVTMAGGIYDGCGAHDLPGRWRATYDLSAGGPIEIADTVGVYERDGQVAVRFFDASPSGLPEDEPGPGGFEGYEFQWTRAGRLQGGYRFGVWACFACSDDPDRSYGRSVLVPDPQLPRWLRPWSRAPRVVARYWRTEPRLRRAWRQVAVWNRTDVFSAKWWFGDGLRTGWSAVEPEHAAKMLEQFAPAASTPGSTGQGRDASRDSTAHP
jgi:hypothetical protein